MHLAKGEGFLIVNRFEQVVTGGFEELWSCARTFSR